MKAAGGWGFDFVSDRFCELTGLRREDILNECKTVFRLIHPDDLTTFISLNEFIEKNPAPFVWEGRAIVHGESRWTHIESRPTQMDNGDVVWSGYFTDITDRKKAEDVFRSTQMFTTTLLENILDGVVACGADGAIALFNRTAREWHGLDPMAIPQEQWAAYYNLYCADGLTPMTEATVPLSRSFRGEVLRNEGMVIRAADRPDRHILASGAPFFDENGAKLGAVVVMHDITERKRAQEDLERSEKFLEQVVENIPNMIFVKEAENLRFVRFNRAGEDLLGYSRGDLLGKNDYDFFLPAQADFFTAKDRAVLTDGKLLDIPEEEIETKLKGKRILHTKKIPILNADGTAQFLLGISEDITERKQFEESQKLQSTAIEQAAEAVIITDDRGVIQYVNTAQEILSGYSRDELIGQTPNVLNSDFHHGNFYEQIWDTIGVGKVWSGRFINRKKDGKEYHQDATISPIYDKSGNLTNFVVVQHDVTQQVELQEQLFQAQKMEAIGTLAGGFAHDFRNMLQVVMGSLELIEFNKDLPDHLRTDLDRIRKAATSGAELVRGMLVFSRKTSVQLEPLNLNKLVEQVESLLARTIPKMIKIDVVKAHDLSSIKGDSTQIEQILMNLAINASDAMPDGGTLTIQTMNTALDEKFCSSHPNTRPGPYVLLSVTDTGTGMNEETVRRIFEPFFTTKEKGKGTGLGLAVVYGIVEQHSARIICESKPSVGTTFRIYFPAIEEVHEEDYSEKTEPPRGLGETILLVDDETSVLEIDSSLLNRANYKVISASNAKDALELYEKHRDEIRLVLLDLIMPEIGGKQCLEALRNMDPNVKVLVLTGYTKRGMTQELKDAGAIDFILKPFDMSLLLVKIRKIIDEGLP
jgi:PAS domain S-box-containing protein